MKRWCWIFLALLLCGCREQLAPKETGTAHYDRPGQSSRKTEESCDMTVFAMDTVMSLSVYGGNDRLMSQAEERIKQLEGLFSVTDENSEIHELNSRGKAKLSEDTERLLESALKMCSRTQGTLDISIYPVVKSWGFTTGEYHVPGKEERAQLLENVDYRKIRLTSGHASLEPDMEIDLGSVAKGYTGDELLALLRENGITSALLNLGGNVQTLGSRPDGTDWLIAIQDPQGSGYLGGVAVSDKAVITSGGYERFFEDEDGNIYWHIIDPVTGAPAENGLISVTVVSESGLLCDALSTSLFVMGMEKAEEHWRQYGDFEAVFVEADGTISMTEGLEESFIPADAGLERDRRIIRRN
ncbi:FAD:protein FMN transferase [Lacrimispora sp. 210928-DFI.3.58]|uniref:FAD:protein FMN transferase n=1 Tax=Lacrimispora sp. 210928-DFI.3.58 TaxID=2883214 RepID=UPI001D075607|nr:FAD:protein FMN transferase [Lacrimispora sp. 210928-DFI.3.58]MCB7318330.1 FAD:protein FMN transferase [Lacrimispora sp. 210928-DFI.3.58]